MTNATILVVEDERITAEDIKAGLKFEGYKVRLFVLLEKMLLVRAKIEPDLILMNIKLKGRMDGIEAAGEIRKVQDIPLIYLTAYSDEKTVERAKLIEPSGFWLKVRGFCLNSLKGVNSTFTIKITLYRHQMEKEHDQISAVMLQKNSEAVFATNSTS